MICLEIETSEEPEVWTYPDGRTKKYTFKTKGSLVKFIDPDILPEKVLEEKEQALLEHHCNTCTICEGCHSGDE